MTKTYTTRLGFYPGSDYTISEQQWGYRNGMYMTFRAIRAQNMLTHFEYGTEDYAEWLAEGVEDFSEAVKLGFVDC